MMVSRTQVQDQVLGSIVNNINTNRLIREALELSIQDENFAKALLEIANVRNFIGSPENILGSVATKHGEIAEHVEVGVRNARSYVNGGVKVATFENIGRTDATDYILNNSNVQSKFYNGINNTLSKGVLGHIEKYSSFTDNGFYIIPKDQYSIVEKILKGEHIDGLSDKSIRAIKESIKNIEQATGKNALEVLRPSVSTYSQIQQGAVHTTLDNHEQDIKETHNEIVNKIKNEHKPNLQECAYVAVTGAGVGAAASLTTGIYKHYKNGKNIFKGDLSIQELKELGIDATKDATIGGISAATIYALTNYADLSAPFASAVVSCSKALASLYMDYKNGNITVQELVDNGLIVCAEGAIVSIATIAGQTLIPIPVVGALVGSVAGSIMIKLLGDDSGKTIAQIKKEMETFFTGLDEAYKRVVKKITEEFDKLGKLTDIAFDLELNTSMINRSIDLARAYNVNENLLLKNEQEVDDYFLK